MMSQISPKLDTMAKIFDYAVQKHGKRDCLGTRQILNERVVQQPEGKEMVKLILDNKYKWQTYDQLSARVTAVAKGLHELGLSPGDKLMIYADTKAEWLITALAAFKSSLSVVTIYTNLGEDGVTFSVNQVKSKQNLMSIFI